FEAMLELLGGVRECRLVLPLEANCGGGLLGGENDRPSRNQLRTRALARRCAAWIGSRTVARFASGTLPQAALIAKDAGTAEVRAITGACALSTGGLGLTPDNQFGLIQRSETADEGAMLEAWFAGLWERVGASGPAGNWL